MIEKITNNLAWKILSIILAFFLWLFVVNYEDPEITRELEGVPVAKLNIAEITDQKKAIEYKEGEYVDLVLRGKRSIMDRLGIDDLYAYVDMGNMSITGAIDIEVEVKEGITVISKSPTNMKVDVEDIITVQKEVQYYFEGEPKDQYIALEADITPNIVQITGPESQIMQVSSVVIPISIHNVSKDVTMLGIPQILDANNIEVAKVESNVDQVQVYVSIEKIKSIPITFRPYDSVPENYVLTDTNIDTEYVKIRGKELVINNFAEIVIDDLSLSELTSDTVQNIDLEEYLPEGVHLVEANKYITIDLQISPLEYKYLTLQPSQISVRNLPESLQFSYVNEENISLRLQGIQEDLDGVNIQSLEPTIRLSGLDEGAHKVPVYLELPKNVDLVSEPLFMEVLLKKDETANSEVNNADVE